MRRRIMVGLGSGDARLREHALEQQAALAHDRLAGCEALLDEDDVAALAADVKGNLRKGEDWASIEEQLEDAREGQEKAEQALVKGGGEKDDDKDTAVIGAPCQGATS